MKRGRKVKALCLNIATPLSVLIQENPKECADRAGRREPARFAFVGV
jgi:hypothetical protein